MAEKDKAAAQVQKTVDAETDQGFRGTAVDPTPNHAYTAEGVAAGEPTPETDEKAAAKAREAVARGDGAR